MSINRRIVVTAVDTMEMREDPIPAPAPGEVRVRSTLIGVCGSDTHAFHGRHPFIPIPYMPGHEATGVVVDINKFTVVKFRAVDCCRFCAIACSDGTAQLAVLLVYCQK